MKLSPLQEACVYVFKGLGWFSDETVYANSEGKDELGFELSYITDFSLWSSIGQNQSKKKHYIVNIPES